MKNILALTLIAVLLMAVPVYAEADATVLDESAGITPDSPLYGLDKALDKLSLRLTFNEQKRAEKALKIAEERLAETEEMAVEGTQEDVQAAEEAHEEAIAEAEDAMNNIDMDGGEEESAEAVETMTELEAQIQTHAQKVVAVKEGILTRLRAEGNMSEEQLAHLEGVFAKIETKAQEMEGKVAEKKENAKTNYKVRTGKTDAEVEEFANQVQEEVQNRVNRSDEGTQTEEKNKVMSGQDDSEDEATDSSEDGEMEATAGSAGAGEGESTGTQGTGSGKQAGQTSE